MLPEKFVVECEVGSKQQDEVMNYYRNVRDYPDFYEGFENWEYITIGYANREGLMINSYNPDTSIPLFTYEQWKEEVSFVLPSKWAVRIKNEEEKHELINWLPKELKEYYQNKTVINRYFHYPNLSGGVFGSENGFLKADHLSPVLRRSSYTEITFEQFKKYVVKKENKKIIGYKAPFNLYGTNPKTAKGTIFIKIGEDYSWYTIEEEKEKSNPNYSLPKEIVETWEPVYEEKEETITIGNRNVEVKIGRNTIHFMGNESTNIEVIKAIYDYHTLGIHGNISGYIVSVDGETRFIRIGCLAENHLFSLNDLALVINTYEKLNK